MKKLIIAVISLGLIGTAAVVGYVFYLKSLLPKMITLKDYQPLLVTEVYDRGGNKIGEFSRERRVLTVYDDIPKVLVNAFLAAEDSSFFTHSGINYVANLRAFLANLEAGEKKQGASTITQQVARSLLLTNEKTYSRKIKEILLAYQMEASLSKKDILYLYLNQIFLGQNSYGVAVAANTYFNKDLKDITLPEAAILAGLPKAPTEVNPIRSSERAKERQRYVLGRMAAEKMITQEEADKAIKEPVKIYMRKSYSDLAPYFLETVRQMLVAKIGDDVVLDQGLKVYTSLDLPKQIEAQKQVQQGLRELDKRQGFRGVLGHEEDPDKVAQILISTRNEMIDKQFPYKVMQPDGTFQTSAPLNLNGVDDKKQPLPVLASYLPPGEIVKAVVTKVDDEWGLVSVRFAESKGLIDFSSMKWARKPDPSKNAKFATDDVKAPSEVLKKGDVILVKIVDDTFTSTRINDQLNEMKRKEKKNFKQPDTLPNFKEYAHVELEQEPMAEAGLLAIDQKTDEIISMVGGYDYARSKLNRTIQTARQTGSSFKTIVYGAALDKDYTPSTAIIDAPIVFEEEQEVEGSDNAETVIKKWKPTNHSNRFVGDILFRNALIHSLNVPSVKIIEKIGVPVSIDYARRLGIFSPLNKDFTLTLGSSSVTLYEMTKVFAEIGRLGRRSRPIIIHRVDDKNGVEISKTVYLDEKFEQQIKPLEDEFERRRQAVLAYQKLVAAGKIQQGQPMPGTPKEAAPEAAKLPETPAEKAAEKKEQDVDTVEADAQRPLHPEKEPPLFFDDPDQLMRPQTAYVMTSLLQGVVDEPGGTGLRAKSLGRPTAGKTGTTNDYFDAWFLGYTPNIVTGVWVGYDKGSSLGRGEVGGRAALPIWLEYMKFAHEGVPVKNFTVPEGIVFASIDNDTGLLATPQSKEVVRQAFISGTEPKQTQGEGAADDGAAQDFFKKDLSD